MGSLLEENTRTGTRRQDSILQGGRISGFRRPPFVLVPVVIAIVVALMIPMFVPLMIVREMASTAVPVTFEESLSIVTRRHPACSFVSRLRPISIVPFVMIAGRIPVACHPKISGARTSRMYPDDTGRWRCADPDSNRNLGEERSSGQQHQYAQFIFHDSSPFLPIALRTMSYPARCWPGTFRAAATAISRDAS